MLTNKLVRLAGASYLILIISGIFGMVYVPSVMFNWHDPLQTMVNFEQNLGLFRWGITGCLVSFIAFTAMSVLLFVIFNKTNYTLALLLLSVGLVGAAAFLANTLSYVEIVSLISSGIEHSVEVAQRILLLSLSFSQGFMLIQVLTGVWLILFGVLAIQSHLLPSIIGWLLIVSGIINYITEFVLNFLLTSDSLPTYISIVGTAGEFIACLWLLILGNFWKQKTQQ